MKDNTTGAWTIHHAKKLSQVQAHSFDEINAAGKSGILLSSLAESENESELSEEKVKVIARAAGISNLELPTVLDKLQKESLIDRAGSSIKILSVTTTSVLTHTAAMFNKANPSTLERAAIDIAEMVSQKPIGDSELKEYVSDTHKLTKSETQDLLNVSGEIGFVDSEQYNSTDEKLYFNGNLFKRDGIQKANKVLQSLSTEEVRKINEVDGKLNDSGYMLYEQVQKILGEELFKKVHSIGMYDVSEVANSVESKMFITKPAAFNKFGNPFEDDALDLAKAFVSALAYGMNYSTSGRGKITMLNALLRKLISGQWTNAATAIGEDYKILELKRVVQLKAGSIPGTFHMKLLKPEIGQLALHVLEQGGAASEESLVTFTGNVTVYNHPEAKREQTRRKRATPQLKSSIIDSLRTLRF